jgi:hypothetical protein
MSSNRSWMYGSRLCNEYIKGVDAFIDFTKKDMLVNIRGNLCCPWKHCKNEMRYHTNNVLRSHFIKHGFMEDCRCWNKHVEEGINEAEMRDSYLEGEVSTGVKEDHDDVNEAYILGFTDGDIEFQVHNTEEMIRNVEKQGDDDQYSNGELAIQYWQSCKVQEDDQRLQEAILSWLCGVVHETFCDG